MTPPFRSNISQSYSQSTTTEYIERLCISWILPIWTLFTYRTLVSLYAFVGLLFTIAWRCTQETCMQAERSFSYFTVLGYWGLAFYHAFAAAHTASYALRGTPWLASWPKWTRYLHSVFYATVTVFPYIVTGLSVHPDPIILALTPFEAIYWAFLANGAFASRFWTWSNVSEHALNSVFAFMESFLPMSDPHPWIHLPLLILILACYLGVAYITHADQGFYVYHFLDP